MFAFNRVADAEGNKVPDNNSKYEPSLKKKNYNFESQVLLNA